MAELYAVQRAGQWRVSSRDIPCTEPATLSRASADGRAAVWRAAQALGTHPSPWDLEYFKASLGEPEIALGLAQRLAVACSTSLADGSGEPQIVLCTPTRYLNLRTVMRVFAGRGLAIRGLGWQTVLDRAQFFLASLGACAALLAYAIRYARHSALPAIRNGLLLAVHADWSNRTRHVLTQLGDDFPADAIILLGRIRLSPAQVVQDWSGKLGIELPPVIVPISPCSVVRALPRLLDLLRNGWRLCVRQPYLPGPREHAAIVFRVLLGAVMQQWWKDSGISGGKVVYGHTGTADTTMLEAAQQSAGATCIHVVHGVATGPNFLGYSDIAVFRCGQDAQRYQALHQYGRCIAPPAPEPGPKRGESGILLFTNYAHPLNAGYIAGGLSDELRILRDVAAIADEIGSRAKPLLWRPHPIMSALPQSLQYQLIAEAKSLGYDVLTPDGKLVDEAARVRWTLATPSTVTLDLLIAGYLCIVLDWQASGVDTAAAQIPTLVSDPAALKGMLNHLDTEIAYADCFHTAWSTLAPAQALGLGTLLKGLQ